MQQGGWHRARSIDVKRLGRGPLAFYDAANQILVYADCPVRTHVVIDHELTHVNVVNNSAVGLLAHVVAFVELCALLMHENASAERALSLAAHVTHATEIVHEAVAWFATELQTQGFENILAPPRYANGVTSLKTLFRRTQRDHPHEDGVRVPQLIDIAESIAVTALNVPLIHDLWLYPDRYDVAKILTSLLDRANNPTSRFRTICTHLKRLSFSDLHRWAQTAGDQSSKRGPEARLDPVATASRFDVLPEQTVRVIQRLAQEWGVTGPKDAAIADLAELWAAYLVTHKFDCKLDRYSQVCVIEAHRPHREVFLNDDLTGQAEMERAQVIQVRICEPQVERFAPLRSAQYGITLIGCSEEAYKQQPITYSSWTTQPHIARAFLLDTRKTQPIIVGSVGYDFGAGDFFGCTVLGGLPHVVVAVMDFRSLWTRLSDGFAGAQRLEWTMAPQVARRSEIGYLIFRPTNQEWPIILHPTILDQARRTMSIIKPGKVSLSTQGQFSSEWIGAAYQSLVTAALLFEM